MKSYSKILSVIVIAAIMFTLAACGAKEVNVSSVDLTVPEGFVESASDPQVWYAPNYPDDPSNINVYKGEHEALFDTYTQELVVASVESQYEELGVDVEITVLDFEKSELNGVPCIMSEFSYEIEGLSIHQLQYMYNAANAIFVVTYTEFGDAGWTEAFKTSAASITLNLE